VLSLTELAFLALLLPALAALASGIMGRPWPASAAVGARWLVRAGLALALADVSILLALIQPAGSVSATIWEFDARLPVTLQVDGSGAVIAIAILAAALVVSFAASEQRPLASAALALAALGGVLVALSGGLLSLFVGLELSAVGGIGLSYARYPRAASSRIVWAAAADQVVAIAWLGAVVVVYHQVGTLEFADIPTGVVTFALAGVLLVPAVVRLAGVGLLAVSSGEPRRSDAARAVDVADWLGVVGVPTALVLILRVRQLAGGSWPDPAFGTALDLVGIVFAGTALGLWLWSSRSGSEARALLLASSGLILLGFGSNSAAGAELAVGAAIFTELAVTLLPRALFLTRRRPSPALVGTGGVAAMVPICLVATVALLGLTLELGVGGALGIVPALGYVLVLAVIGMVAARSRGLVGSPGGWDWALAVPAAGLLAAALVPGWVLTSVAALIAFPGAAVASGLTAPNPFVVQLGSTLWPLGYLVILLGLAAVAWLALRYAVGLEVWAGSPSGQPGEPARAPWGRIRLPAAAESAGRELLAWSKRIAGAGSLALELADRDLAERPIWLWLATAAIVGWLMVQR